MESNHNQKGSFRQSYIPSLKGGNPEKKNPGTGKTLECKTPELDKPLEWKNPWNFSRIRCPRGYSVPGVWIN